MIRWLGQPARLFVLATVVIALPALLQAGIRRTPPKIEARLLSPPHAGNARIIASHVVTFDANGRPTEVRGGTGGAKFSVVAHEFLPSPLRVALLASFPVFAVCYTLWPRVCKRPLDARLGRGHFALAVVPTIVAPFAGILVLFALGFMLPRWLQDGHALLITEQVIATMFTGVAVATGLLWFTGLVLFGINVRNTLRRRGLEP